MILEREQINRYLRHIIMPEISGPGQKKLLESSVFICGESAKDAASAIYYLAASGIGSILCHFNNSYGAETIFINARDINSDVKIQMEKTSTSDIRIYLGKPNFLLTNMEEHPNSFVPTILASYHGWKGTLRVFKEIITVEDLDLHDRVEPDEVPESAHVLSSCLCGALCAMEATKLILGIGEWEEGYQYFDLFGLEFATIKDSLQNVMKKVGSTLKDGFEKSTLRDKKVLIAGTGGLGSPAAFALALSGIGTIGFVDYDRVEISNLNRQILHATSRVGKYKAESAAFFLKEMCPDIDINIYNTSINKENVFDLIKEYDVVIDAVDNFPTRFLLNDACYLKGKTLIDAGVLRFDGTFTTFIPGEGPCYRCMLSDIPAAGSVPSCSEAGVLGPVPGIMGFIQAAEAVKLLSGQGVLGNGKFLFFDGLYSEFRLVDLSKKSTCPLCGENPTIHELQQYEFVCGDTEG